MDHTSRIECPDCESVDRRDFVRTVAMGGIALGMSSQLLLPGTVSAKENGPLPRVVNTVAEDLVKELMAGLDATQKKAVVKPWTDRRRKIVNPNRALDKTIGTVYTKPQQDLVMKIVKAIAADEKAMHIISRAGTWDNSKTFDNCGADMFVDESGKKFAFLLSGHHLTIRCDGDSEEGAAFGGPIYYGHTPNGYSDRNVFAYQTKEVAHVFDALDPKQREKALITKGNPGEGEKSVVIKPKAETRPGIAYMALTKDQQELVDMVLKTILSPFRQQDGNEVVDIIKATGGMAKVHLAFYGEGNEGTETDAKQPWSFWRLEGPGMVWNFRVLPHVHTFVNISSKVG